MVVRLRRELVGRARASLAGGGGRSERWAAPWVFYAVSLSGRLVAAVSRPDGSVRRKRAFRRGGPSLRAAWLSALAIWCALLAKRKPDNRPARRSVSNRISVNPQPCNRCSSSSHAAPPRCCRRLRGNTERAASCAWAGACVEINQCAGCTQQFFTNSFLGDDAAVLVRSSGEEPASPRHRAGVASMAWRSTR